MNNYRMRWFCILIVFCVIAIAVMFISVPQVFAGSAPYIKGNWSALYLNDVFYSNSYSSSCGSVIVDADSKKITITAKDYEDQEWVSDGCSGSMQTVYKATTTTMGFTLSTKASITLTFSNGIRCVKIVNGTSSAVSSGATYTCEPNTVFKFTISSPGTNNTASGDVTLSVTPIAASLEDAATYYVSTTGQYYQYLDEAIAAANGSGKITVVGSGLAYGKNTNDFVIPDGVQLLIPYSAEDDGTFYASSSEQILDYLTEKDSCGLIDEDTTGNVRNFAFRTLTLPTGSTITCYGDINVNGRYEIEGQPYTGVSVGGYGKLILGEENDTYQSDLHAQLIIGSGGTLYSYGYITGSGMVEVASGGQTHEFFQLADFGGGGNTNNWNNATKNSKGTSMFLLSQYYIQNIEAPLKINYGATANAEAVIAAGGYKVGTSACVIGSSGLFQMSKPGDYILRIYTQESDRINYHVYGTASIGAISIHIEAQAGLIHIDETFTSSNYILPLNGSMSIYVEDGSTMTCSNQIALLPGSEIIIESGGTANLSNNIFLWASGDWSHSYFFSRKASTDSTIDHSPLPYVATLDSISPRATSYVRSTTDDGTPKYYTKGIKNHGVSGRLVVNGTLNLTGGSISRTDHKTNTDPVVTGTGKIIYTPTAAAATLTAGHNAANAITTAIGYGYIIDDFSAWTQTTVSASNFVGDNTTYYGYYYDVDGDLIQDSNEFFWLKENSAVIHLVDNGKIAATLYASFATGSDLSSYYTNIECTSQATSSYEGGSVLTLYLPATAKVVQADDRSDQYYTSLHAAVVNALQSGDAVHLLQNVSVSKVITITASQNISIYLGGNTITYTSSVFNNKGILYLDFEGGTITSATPVYAYIIGNQKGATLTLNLNGGTLLWSSSVLPSAATFGLVENFSGGIASVDLAGGTIEMKYTCDTGPTSSWSYRSFALRNSSTMTLTDSVGTGLLTSSYYSGDGVIATGGTGRGWAYVAATLCNDGGGTLIAYDIHITHTATKGYAACIINNGATIAELKNVRIESSKDYALINTGGTIQNITNCQIEATNFGIYNCNTYNSSFVITRKGIINTILNTNIIVTGKEAISNRGYIGTIGGSSEIKAATNTIYNYNYTCGSGYYVTTTTTDSAGNSITTYNWTDIPTIDKITDSVTITATSYNAITNNGDISEISGNVSINANAVTDPSKHYAIGLLSGGYIETIKDSVSIMSSNYNGIYLSGRRTGTVTKNSSGTEIGRTYDRTSSIGTISGSDYTYTNANGVQVTDRNGIVVYAKRNTVNNAGQIGTIGDGTVVIRAEQNALHNSGTITKLSNGLVVITTDTTGTYYALNNVGTVTEISGGDYHHGSGNRANAVYNADAQTYPTGYKLSPETRTVTVTLPVWNAETSKYVDTELTYECYYVSLKFYATNINLGNDLDLLFAIPVNRYSDWSNCKVVFSRAGKEDVAIWFADWEERGISNGQSVIGDKGYYVFTYGDFAAKEMCDEVTITIYDGDTAISVLTTSIRDYATKVLGKTADAKLRTMVVDMLNYGAACQNKFNYKTDDLANKNLTDEQKGWASPELSLSQGTSPDAALWNGSQLIVESNIIFQIKIADAAAANAKSISYQFNGHLKDNLDLVKHEDTMTDFVSVLNIDELVVADADCVIEVKIYYNDGTTKTFTESIAQYMKRMDAQTDGLAVYKEFLEFAYSARTYLQSKVTSN